MHRIQISFFMSVALLFVGSCAVEPPADDVGAEASALSAGSITFSANGAVADEHCRVHADRAADWPAGRQLLIYRGSTLRGSCTVDATASTIGADTIEM